MNQRERDALRNEHTKVTGFIGNKEIVPYCLGCGDYIDDDRQPYPCDVIKVLDAWEAEVHDDSEVSTTREVCDHADRTSYAYSDEYYVDMGYRYCPKCGNKLDNG